MCVCVLGMKSDLDSAGWMGLTCPGEEWVEGGGLANFSHHISPVFFFFLVLFLELFPPKQVDP